jgi:nucleoside-diphosphate-sugar epimerase
MPEPRTLLVAGATGAAASRLVARAASTPGWQVVGLCRTPPADRPGVRFVAANLADAAACRAAVREAAPRGVTHAVYAARAAFGEGGVEDVPANLAMLDALVAAAEGPMLRHVHLVEGTKWYGMHIGPYPTPAREDDPRHLPPNFYYDQQDLLAARAAAGGWAWSASRPAFIVDVAPGRARNLASTLGAYAAICRELGVALDFPGTEASFRSLVEVTDAALLARAVLWMLESPHAAGRAFNVTNGDVFRFARLWPRLAAAFAMPCGIVRPMKLATWMADKAPVWERIRARAGLRLPLPDVARWDFADFALGLEHDLFAATTRLRQAGFADCLDTIPHLLGQVDAYRAERVLP